MFWTLLGTFYADRQSGQPATSFLNEHSEKIEQHGPIALGIWTHIYIYTHRVWYHQGWLQGPRRGPGASKIGPSTWRIWQHWSCQMAKQQERTAVKPRTRHSLSYPNGRFNIKHQDENFIPNLAHWAPNQEDVYITALWHLHHVSKMKTSKCIYIYILSLQKKSILLIYLSYIIASSLKKNTVKPSSLPHIGSWAWKRPAMALGFQALAANGSYLVSG